MSLRIHAFPPSPRGFKALSFANHIGIDFEFVLVDLTKGAQRTPEFAKLNLNQRMPVLEEDGWSLWESNAILQYLATKKPELGLLPKDERGRADVSRWMFWESAHWDQACAMLIWERFVKGLFGGGPADPAEVEKGLANFHRAAKVLDQHLKGRDFVCGALTCADFALGSPMILAEPAGFPLEDYAEIRRWYGRLAALPAWSKTQAMGQMPAAA
ncbi:MAG: glutathione S-transferase family protein [Alphaproteobacteria bacterium]|nr:glutathione S-transferase family protein [Alphaproteobacteria bacterium]